MLALLLLLPFATWACPLGASVNSQGKCLTLYTSMKSWTQAEQVCNTKGGHLASIHNGFDSSFTNVLAAPSCKFYYVGGKCSSQKCHWLDSTSWNYNNWMATEPGTGTALSVNADNAQWKTVSGSSAECFICQTDQ